MTPKRYRKKPVVIEAMQWVGDWEQAGEFCGFAAMPRAPRSDDLVISTLEGDMIANLNDWIIKGVKGEIYPCKPDIFAATYEEV